MDTQELHTTEEVVLNTTVATDTEAETINSNEVIIMETPEEVVADETVETTVSDEVTETVE